MTTAPIPICESCARLEPGPEGRGTMCAAFPGGIPDAIYIGGADHRRRIRGDRGIRFRLSGEGGAAGRLAAYEASHGR